MVWILCDTELHDLFSLGESIRPWHYYGVMLVASINTYYFPSRTLVRLWILIHKVAGLNPGPYVCAYLTIEVHWFSSLAEPIKASYVVLQVLCTHSVSDALNISALYYPPSHIFLLSGITLMTTTKKYLGPGYAERWYRLRDKTWRCDGVWQWLY